MFATPVINEIIKKGSNKKEFLLDFINITKSMNGNNIAKLLNVIETKKVIKENPYFFKSEVESYCIINKYERSKKKVAHTVFNWNIQNMLSWQRG
jgi:hypothetical protein